MQFLDITGLATFLAKLKTTFLGIDATAKSAETLGSETVGSGTTPIYLNSGVATASTSTVGSGTKPVYLSSGTLTASSSTVGSGTRPVYLSSGTLTALSSTVGSTTKPVYLSSGTITETGDSLDVSVTGTATETQTALDAHIADTNNPHNVTAAQLGLASAYRYMGSVTSYSDLPTDASTGDVYNIVTADTANGINAGDNVAWTGTEWDNLAGVFDTSTLEGLVAEKAPIYHASSSTEYGVGSGTLYGHVKLYDTANSSYTVSSGIAATPAAVQAAIDSFTAISDEDIEALFA